MHVQTLVEAESAKGRDTFKTLPIVQPFDFDFEFIFQIIL
jgi:hypothetical protein